MLGTGSANVLRLVKTIFCSGFHGFNYLKKQMGSPSSPVLCLFSLTEKPPQHPVPLHCSPFALPPIALYKFSCRWRRTWWIYEC